MNKVTYQEAHEPTVFITKNKQRIKQYDNTVYLNNGDEFELELFNPLTEKVLAKIKINNKYIDDSGIIIRSGERVFLERYINEARKFVYSIYNVESNSPVVQKAIEHNGDVVVEFHREYHDNNIVWNNTCNTVYYNNPSDYKDITAPRDFYNFCGDLNFNSAGTTMNMDGASTLTTSNSVNYSSEVRSEVRSKSLKKAPLMYSLKSVKMEETGTVEKGAHSDQQFTYDSTMFATYHTWSTSWKILPASKKPVYREEIKVYCTNCGAKRKKSSFKFCPNCGNQF